MLSSVLADPDSSAHKSLLDLRTVFDRDGADAFQLEANALLVSTAAVLTKVCGRNALLGILENIATVHALI